MVHLCGGVRSRPPRPIDFINPTMCQGHSNRGSCMEGGSRDVCALSTFKHPTASTKHNTIASAACFESFVSPHTWLMLSTRLGSSMAPPPEHNRYICTVLACLSRSCTPMQIALTRLQLHHLARSQDRAFLGTYGCLRSAPLAAYYTAASAPISTNLLNPPKHWRGLLPYRLSSGSLFSPDGAPCASESGFWPSKFWLQPTGPRTCTRFNHHADHFPCICR